MRDPWAHLREATPARIALGRAGPALPTRELLAFAADHAAARDAVRAALDTDRLAGELAHSGCHVFQLASAAADRAEYLRRPDLGKRLSEPSIAALRSLPPLPCDLSIVVADGLSALAAQTQAAPLLHHLLPLLTGLRLAPLCVVTQARVAIQDDIGERLGALASVIFLGERPGLGSADSLGAYLVFGPRPGTTDERRNCVSNIRPGGLSLQVAAETLAYLIREMMTRQLSGVELKDDRGDSQLSTDTPPVPLDQTHSPTMLNPASTYTFSPVTPDDRSDNR